MMEAAKPSRPLQIYDPATGTFRATGNMISARATHTASLLASGEVLVVGGWNGHAAAAADDPPWDPVVAESFEPSSGSFKMSGGMRTTRIQPVAARLPDGKVLVLGGFRNPQNLHEQPTNPPYAEKYDPVAHVFSALANLTLSRDGYTATLLANGELLLAGGEDLGHTVGTSQLLNPDTGSLIDTGDLITERKGHTATLLNDGRVLITGGVDSNGVTLASAELYW